MKFYSALKRNDLSSHEKTWRTLNAHYKMKEANVKRLHIVLFQPYDILQKAKLWKKWLKRDWRGK